MSYFKGLKLTRQGEQLLAKVNGNIGEILTFTRGELGSGRIDSEDEVYYLTALKNKWGELAITEITRTGEVETQVRIETQFTNAEWTEEKILREIGIYAKGKESSEILFAYSNAGENYDKIPIPQDNPQSFLIGITFKISTATKVDATISFSGFVTIEKLEEELAKKEDKISTKNTAFNKNFGVLEGEVLEGHRLAQALGLEFAGELNNVNLKQAGKAYWDNVNKSIYKCLVDNTLNYAESTKFEALSNHDLLLKLQNLVKVYNPEEVGNLDLNLLTEYRSLMICLNIYNVLPKNAPSTSHTANMMQFNFGRRFQIYNALDGCWVRMFYSGVVETWKKID